MITTEADNDKRLTWVLNRWEIVWTISFIVFSCKNEELSFLFGIYIYNYMHRIRKCVQKVIDNIYKNSPWAW